MCVAKAPLCHTTVQNCPVARSSRLTKTAELLAHPALELEFPSWEAAVFQDLRRCYPSLPLIFAHEPHLIHRLAESLDTMSKRLLVAELLVAGSRRGFWQLWWSKMQSTVGFKHLWPGLGEAVSTLNLSNPPSWLFWSAEALSDDVKLLVTMEHVRSKGAPLSYHCKHVLLLAGMLCSTLQPSAKTAELLAPSALEQEFPSWGWETTEF